MMVQACCSPRVPVSHSRVKGPMGLSFFYLAPDTDRPTLLDTYCVQVATPSHLLCVGNLKDTRSGTHTSIFLKWGCPSTQQTSSNDALMRDEPFSGHLLVSSRRSLHTPHGLDPVKCGPNEKQLFRGWSNSSAVKALAVQFPAPTPGSSEPPASLTPGDLVPPLAFTVPIHTCMDRLTGTHTH